MDAEGSVLSERYDKPVIVNACVPSVHICASDVAGGDVPWIRVPGVWKDVSLWGDENFVAVNNDGHVFKRVAGVLTQIDGVLEHVISDSLGSVWFGINECGQLFKCDGIDSVSVDGAGIWKNVANGVIFAKSIVLDRGARELYVLTREGHVWVNEIETGHWTRATPMGPLEKPHKLVVHCDNTIVHIDSSRAMWSMRPVYRVDGCDRSHWEWRRLNVTSIESGCTGAWTSTSTGEDGGCRMWGIDSRHTIRQFFNSWKMNKPSSVPLEGVRARLVAHHENTLAYITDAGAMYWRPSE